MKDVGILPIWRFGLFLQLFDSVCGYLQYFMVIWHIFPILVCCSKKNLATQICTCISRFLMDKQKCFQ
jgi:hypothetical protein